MPGKPPSGIIGPPLSGLKGPCRAPRGRCHAPRCECRVEPDIGRASQGLGLTIFLGLVALLFLVLDRS